MDRRTPENRGAVAFRKRRLALGFAAFAFAAAAMTGCAGFWHALGEGDSTEDVYCDKRRVGYAVTDGKRTEAYRLDCPAWVDNIMETRERAKARGWKEDE